MSGGSQQIDHSVIVGMELLFVCLNFIGLYMEKVTIFKLDVLNFIVQLCFEWLTFKFVPNDLAQVVALYPQQEKPL